MTEADTMMTKKVTLVNMKTKKTCLHSELPLAIREPFVYDYKDTILVCSATSGQNKVNLQCFEWDATANKWKVFPVTGFQNNVIDTEPTGTFISSARLPGNIFLLFELEQLHTSTSFEGSYLITANDEYP